jgi:hypothetical protein
MLPQPKVPLTPGRFAFGWTCAAALTCGVLSPLSLVISLWALKRPEPLGLVALAVSALLMAMAGGLAYIYTAPIWVPLLGG